MSNARHLYPKGALILRELGLRDGLQMTAGWLGTAAKIEWINLAFAAGVRHFEVGSFLPPSRFPQFADLRELIAAVDALPGAVSSALVLNERGIADALETPVDEIVIPVSVTEAHSMANMRRPRSSAVELIRTAIGKKGLSDSGPVVNAAAAVAFGCSISGEVRVDDVLDLIGECVEAGAEALAVADTVGFAGPAQVAGLCSRLVNEFDDFPIKVHLHDTRGTGIANAYAALEAGIRILDGTVGGLGGCPFAPGATGNVVFEDLVFLCERCGLSTGIDLEKLMLVRHILERELPGESLHGALAGAGVPTGIDWQARNSAISGR